MELVAALGRTLGLSFAAGINLYATVVVLGSGIVLYPLAKVLKLRTSKKFGVNGLRAPGMTMPL